jgi:hypothetical protein
VGPDVKPYPSDEPKWPSKLETIIVVLIGTVISVVVSLSQCGSF